MYLFRLYFDLFIKNIILYCIYILLYYSIVMIILYYLFGFTKQTKANF